MFLKIELLIKVLCQFDKMLEEIYLILKVKLKLLIHRNHKSSFFLSCLYLYSQVFILAISIKIIFIFFYSHFLIKLFCHFLFYFFPLYYKFLTLSSRMLSSSLNFKSIASEFILIYGFLETNSIFSS